MEDKLYDVQDYEVTTWLEETGWPTMSSDLLTMHEVYAEWKMLSPRQRFSNVLYEDMLVSMISHRTKQKHKNSHRDASVITALLILSAANLAIREGLI